ncbi:hypothetical protein CW362_22035 [Streptomyces populi]|uniref:Uncharacterized protein n=1 Tax=Streptomyces populi TaxID=2058924 RepID=A0A2I0SM28_9ACTN|nr:hypothetical protein CW362_22035 [Streptomyces populi]
MQSDKGGVQWFWAFVSLVGENQAGTALQVLPSVAAAEVGHVAGVGAEKRGTGDETRRQQRKYGCGNTSTLGSQAGRSGNTCQDGGRKAETEVHGVPEFRSTLSPARADARLSHDLLDLGAQRE